MTPAAETLAGVPNTQFIPLCNLEIAPENLRAKEPADDEIRSLVDEMKITLDKLVRDKASRGDVKLVQTALAELRYAFKVFGKLKGVGVLDYVCGWYYRAMEYIGDRQIDCAFVSTNSITQGEHVGIFWKELSLTKGAKINFAHRTFAWESEARGRAHVHVVIVGFSKLMIAFLLGVAPIAIGAKILDFSSRAEVRSVAASHARMSRCCF